MDTVVKSPLNKWSSEILKYLQNIYFIFFLILASIFYVYYPSFSVFFHRDDLSLLNNLVENITSGNYLKWLLSPNNEHFIPIVKPFYFLNYHLFGFNSHPLHIFTMLLHFISSVLFYRVSLILFDNKKSALLFTSFFAASAIYSETIYWICTSIFIFNSIFNFASFYSLILFKRERKKKYIIFSAISALFVVFTGVSGLLYPILLTFFIIFCINIRTVALRLYTIPLMGWLIGFLIYLFSRYKFYFETPSALELLNILQGLRITYLAISQRLISEFTFIPLSLITFILVAISTLCYRIKIRWNYILFLFLYLFINYLVIFSFRYNFGERVIFWSRYHYIPSFAFILIYSGLTAPFFASTRVNQRLLLFFSAIFLFSHAFLSSEKIKILTKIGPPDTKILRDFSREVKSSVAEFDRISNSKKIEMFNLHIKLGDVLKESVPISYYINIILEKRMRDKINWVDFNRTEFLDFIERNKRRYPILHRIYYL